jgi:hypothetical protein
LSKFEFLRLLKTLNNFCEARPAAPISAPDRRRNGGLRRCRLGEQGMRSPSTTVRAAEALGRVRLFRSLFMRDFLHSEIASMHGLSNLPENPDLAIAAGRRLCEELWEPLQATFGRIAIRSGVSV